MNVRASEREEAPSDLIAAYGADVERALERLDLGGDLPLLDEPIRYVLRGGGKRLRPVLVLLAANMWSDELADIMPAALSVEVFHNFTLVHDDIMDHAVERRARPSVHIQWDEATAILAGDYLLALAYRLLTECRRGDLRSMLSAYHRMVRRLCEGQALDKAFETRMDVSVDEYDRMIYAKTGALIECCLELGGIAAGASSSEIDELRHIGRHIGRAFQVQDDLLDVTASDARWGKPVGGDLIEGKRTFILLRALERADGEDRAWFDRILTDGGLPPSDVPEAQARLRALGVLDEAAEVVNEHSSHALDRLEHLPAGPPRVALSSLVLQLQSRVH